MIILNRGTHLFKDDTGFVIYVDGELIIEYRK